MVHGVTEEELKLFTVGGASVLTLIVLTLLVDEAAIKYVIDCFKFESNNQRSDILRKSDLIFSV